MDEDPTKQCAERAAALIIGNELLTGKITERNLVVLARTLRQLGVALDRVVMVRDERAIIANELRALSQAFDVVFTSGGVGPTHDDVTIDAVADAFELRVEDSDQIAGLLREFYGDAITDGHLRMARVPCGARLLTTGEMPWPTIVVNNVWILPGVPEIFAMKMPVVKEKLRGARAFHSLATYTKLDEGNLKPLLDQVVSEHQAVELGSYPKWKEPRYRTQVTFDGEDHKQVQAAHDALIALLPPGTHVVLDEEP